MIPLPSPKTRLIALLGDPVAHSLSPTFQNAAFRAAGVDGVYLALRCSAADLAALVGAIARAGGAGNVTLPHKSAAASFVERPTREVQRTGACNTFWEEGGEIWGDNTDVAGADRAIIDLLGSPASGARVLLLGAGGAARAAVCALLDQGVGEIVLQNRTRARAEAVVAAFPEATGRLRPIDSLAPLRRERFDLVINATALGLRPGDELPLELGQIGGIGAALDLVYRPESTPWTHHLRSHGIPAEDGLGMLVHQGAVGFERWWRVSAPVEEMRAALGRVPAHGDEALARATR